MNHPPISILIVDNHTLLLESLKTQLEIETDLHVVGVANDWEGAVCMAGRLHPDILIMDVDWIGSDCFRSATEIVRNCRNTRVIYLSAFPEDRYIERALAAHAWGYVTKDEPPTIIIEAIRRAKSGLAYFSPPIQNRIVVDANGDMRLKSVAE